MSADGDLWPLYMYEFLRIRQSSKAAAQMNQFEFKFRNFIDEGCSDFNWWFKISNNSYLYYYFKPWRLYSSFVQLLNRPSVLLKFFVKRKQVHQLCLISRSFQLITPDPCKVLTTEDFHQVYYRSSKTIVFQNIMKLGKL